MDPFSVNKQPYLYLVNGFYYSVWSVGFKKDGAVVKVDEKTGKVTVSGEPIWVSNGDNHQ